MRFGKLRETSIPTHRQNQFREEAIIDRNYIAADCQRDNIHIWRG